MISITPPIMSQMPHKKIVVPKIKNQKRKVKNKRKLEITRRINKKVEKRIKERQAGAE